MRHNRRILSTAFLLLLITVPSCTPAPIYRGHERKKKARVSREDKSAQKEQVPSRDIAGIGFQPPLASFSLSRINSRYGIRKHPRYHTSEMHTGIDIEAALGEEVLASAGGRVIFTGKQGSYGKVVIIEHAERVCSVYAHLSAIAVKKGESVLAGQYIANVGLTGNSTGAHLHFEIRVEGKAVDPEPYIR